MENSFPFCKPESNPAGFPPDAAKYTQGFPNKPCVTELEVEFLYMHRMSMTKKIILRNFYEGKRNVTRVPLSAAKLEGS